MLHIDHMIIVNSSLTVLVFFFLAFQSIFPSFKERERLLYCLVNDYNTVDSSVVSPPYISIVSLSLY